MKINLLAQPEDLYSLNWTNILLYFLLIIIIFTPGVHYYLMRINYIQVRERLNGIENQLSILSAGKERYDKLEAEIKQLEALQVKSNANTYNWPIMVREHGFIIPDKIVYHNMGISEKKLYLNGLGIDNARVIMLMDNLNNSPYFENVRLMRINQGDDGINFTLEADISAGGEPGV